APDEHVISRPAPGSDVTITPPLRGVMARYTPSLGGMNLGPGELIVILGIVLILFGGAKLPQLAKALGQAKREVERAVSDDDKKSTDEEKASSQSSEASSES